MRPPAQGGREASLNPVFFDLLLAALGCGLVACGVAILRRRRLIETLPTSPTGLVREGLAEIEGEARPAAPLTAPLSGQPCVYYRYKLEEQRRGRPGRRQWRTVDRGESEQPFYLEDSSGRIRVEPAGAEMVLRRDFRSSGWGGLLSGRKRLSEWRIEPGDRVFVLGTLCGSGSRAVARRAARSAAASEAAGAAGSTAGSGAGSPAHAWSATLPWTAGRDRPPPDAERDRRAALAGRLRALKRDPAALARIDTDREGQVSTEEWEAAVVEAGRQVASEEASHEDVHSGTMAGASPGDARRRAMSGASPGDARGGAMGATAPADERVIRRGEDERAFIISDHGEETLRLRLGFQAAVCLLAGPTLASTSAISVLTRSGLLTSGWTFPWK